MESPRKSLLKNWLILIVNGLVVSIGLNIYVLFRLPATVQKQELYIVENSDQKIKEIETYLDSISTSYMADEQQLARERNIQSWGCGPSSYALAKIINKKFFDDQFTIDASYKNTNPYQIIERFSLAGDGEKVVDHAWIEIYFKDKFLFVDPSVAQFGKINKIAYQVFTIGQSDIGDILKNQYGIRDVRLSLLIPKVVNRIPKDEPPYPGATISEESINYFLKSLEERNSVNDGIEPSEWKDWVSFLVNKYLG